MNHLIVAYDASRGIGKNGNLPWNGQLPADMEHFKQTTIGSAVIMGRSTYESIGRPLPNRQNIVLSRSAIYYAGVTVIGSLENALDSVMDGKDAYIIGGGKVYADAIVYADSVIATEINKSFDDVDTYFPELPNDWTEQAGSRQSFPADADNHFAYSYVTYTPSKG